jgi:transglutaminase/protease-like cytokinesis protein 3
MIDTDEPGAHVAATISRFSASGHDRLRRLPFDPVVSITDFVDTSTLANDKNQITLHIRPNAAIQKDGPHRRETLRSWLLDRFHALAL